MHEGRSNMTKRCSQYQCNEEAIGYRIMPNPPYPKNFKSFRCKKHETLYGDEGTEFVKLKKEKPV